MNRDVKRPPMTTAPCPRCLKLAIDGRIRAETVMPLPEGAFAPLGHNNQKCCFDCQSADNVVRLAQAPGFEAARIAVGNDRQEAIRLPEGIVMAECMGLIKAGYMRPYPNQADWDTHQAWLKQHVWPLIPEDVQR